MINSNDDDAVLKNSNEGAKKIRAFRRFVKSVLRYNKEYNLNSIDLTVIHTLLYYLNEMNYIFEKKADVVYRKRSLKKKCPAVLLPWEGPDENQSS